jgi:hypothetical protein
VGLPAPDFKATAVYDQEFMDVTLSDYKCASCEHDLRASTAIAHMLQLTLRLFGVSGCL